MFIQFFLDEDFGHTSYLVGCQRAKVAIVIDPSRDIAPYLTAAKDAGLRIEAVAETHIPSDYISGAHELAARHGATLFVSGEASNRSRYAYLPHYGHQMLRDGDHFYVGMLRFDVLYTPGATPESISLLLTDEASGANEPMGIFTGDLLQLGAFSRPETLVEGEIAIDQPQQDAQHMFASLNRFRGLPEYLQVWPTHLPSATRAGDGKAIPSSTVGYEKRFNPTLRFINQEEFVQAVRDSRPETCPGNLRIRLINQAGATLVSANAPQPMEAELLKYAVRVGNMVDLSPVPQFARGHFPESINIPLDRLPVWGRWLLDDAKSTFLIGKPEELSKAVHILHQLGVEEIGGVFFRQDLLDEEMLTQTYPTLSPDQLATPIGAQRIQLIDVRPACGWRQGHIPFAKHFFLGKLRERLQQIPKDPPVVVQCQDGILSGIAASLLQAKGYKVTNLGGGLTAWDEADLPIIRLDANKSPRRRTRPDAAEPNSIL